MKPVTEEQKERFSLTILFSVIVLVFLILTTIIVSIILSVMVYRGKLEIGDIKLSAGRFILDMLLWSTGIGALITLLTMRYPLKPVNRFLNVLDRLAHGDFSARLSFTGPFSSVPAVKEVADGVNLMAAELEQTEILREDFINNFCIRATKCNCTGSVFIIDIIRKLNKVICIHILVIKQLIADNVSTLICENSFYLICLNSIFLLNKFFISFNF